MRDRDTGIRAGDEDRNRTIDVLANAFSDGQLTQPEYEQRSAAALQAPTLAELRVLTGDLQDQPQLVGAPDAPSSADLPPTHQSGGGPVLSPAIASRTVAWVLWLLTVAVVVGLVLFGRWLFEDESDAAAISVDVAEATAADGDITIEPLVIPEPPNLLTAEGLAGMVAAMRREIGSTTVTSLHLQDDYATFEMRRRGEPGTYNYHYDGFVGVPSHDETGTADGPPLDLADVDPEAVQRLMQRLPETVGIREPTTRYVTLERGSRQPLLRYYLGGARGAGWVIADPAGRVVQTFVP